MTPTRTTLLLALLLAAASAIPASAQTRPKGPGAEYRGIDRSLAVALPHEEADVEVDGVLDENAWTTAAVLTGFSQYEPVDGLPAPDDTEVLIWYSAHALFVGIRARETHGPVNATLADRDHIFGDDYTQILLDPFHDGRRALLFAVNPLGIQTDGIQTEEQRSGQRFGADEAAGSVDLNPDYVFESKGRVTEDGYEVEIRIPFKSLRYPSVEPQTWGINIVRRVQHSGSVQTWTPVRRGETSFLAQGGTLDGLEGMRRGLVLDVNPEVTSQVTGMRATDGGWGYDRQASQWGGNVRWGVTTDLTANATVNPDFSQVETDAAQISFDPRNALSYPEKRPFFLEGAEQFAAPNNLIYTRRIVDPVAAGKLAGKVGGTDIGILTAVDDASLSRTGSDRPLYNLLRVRRPIGDRSVLGLTWTDRVEGSDYNRVGSVDARLVSGGYTFTAVAAASRTRADDETVMAPMWTANLQRSGRTFGWSLLSSGSSSDFLAGSGFQSRTGLTNFTFTPRITRFGGADSHWDSWSTSLMLNGMWLYDRLGEGKPDEAKLHLNNSIVFKGGWNLGASFLIERFRLPPGLYDGYAIDLGTDTVPFIGRPTIDNFDFVFTLGTPQFPTFSGTAFLVLGRDENFAEWAPGYIIWSTLTGTWRPTDRVRLEGSYNETRVLRASDRSQVSIVAVPRLKLEYQLARPLFVRLVGQYVSRQLDVLRDDGRTARPILQLDSSTGAYVAQPALSQNDLRFDALLSYRPTPGTVVFFGYGGALREDQAFRFSGLDRRGDAFFVKLSYLFRM